MKFFTLEELGANSEGQFHPNFLRELEILRQNVSRPFIVTSCARSLKYNRKVGGSSKSLHIWDKPQRAGQRGCMAIDLAVVDPSFKPAVADVALLLGWSIGVNDAKKFIHLDRRVDIGEPKALFSYG